MPGTLLIRADGGPEMGTGHVMRALALAHAWRAAGGAVQFITACASESLRQRIRAAGAELVLIERPHPDPADLGEMLRLLAKDAQNTPSTSALPQQDIRVPCPRLRGHVDRNIRHDHTDATAGLSSSVFQENSQCTAGQASSGTPCQRAAGGSQVVWIMLDGYHLDTAYQQTLRAAGGRLLVLDDQAHLDHYHADVLLNQNVNAQGLNYLCDANTVLLLGPHYALLRPEYHPWQTFQREIPPVAQKLLITLGGADPDNVTGRVVAGLARLEHPKLETRVVVGAAYRHLDALRDQVARIGGHQIEILSDVDNFPQLMAWADVAVSAAGITCWELALMQVPTLLVALIELHGPIIRGMVESSAAVDLGSAERLSPETVADAIVRLCRNAALRATLAAAGRRLVDGRGAERVVALMRALDETLPTERLLLRRASLADARSLWRLANDPAVRRSRLGSDGLIPWATHLRWLKRRLASPGSRVWVIECDGLLLALVRYDKTDAQAAEASLVVAPAFRRRGLAVSILDQTWQPACEELDVRRIRAIVRQENDASARTFAKAGFSPIENRQVAGHPCLVFQRQKFVQ